MEYVDVYTINKESVPVQQMRDYLEYALVDRTNNSVQPFNQDLTYKVERWPVKQINHCIARDKLGLDTYTERQYVAIQPELMDTISILDESERNWWLNRIESLEDELESKEEDLKGKNYRINIHNYSGYFLKLWAALLGRKV